MDRLKELIADWRAEGARLDTFHATMGTGYKVCADELEAALKLYQTADGRWWHILRWMPVVVPAEPPK